MNYSPFLISPVCIRGFSNGTIGNIITVYLNFITNGTIGNNVGAKCKNINYIGATSINEPHREKTGFLPRRKQRRRSASR